MGLGARASERSVGRHAPRPISARSAPRSIAIPTSATARLMCPRKLDAEHQLHRVRRAGVRGRPQRRPRRGGRRHRRRLDALVGRRCRPSFRSITSGISAPASRATSNRWCARWCRATWIRASASATWTSRIRVSVCRTSPTRPTVSSASKARCSRRPRCAGLAPTSDFVPQVAPVLECAGRRARARARRSAGRAADLRMLARAGRPRECRDAPPAGSTAQSRSALSRRRRSRRARHPRNQEQYMRLAWEQIGEVLTVNHKIRRAQLAIKASAAAYTRTVVARCRPNARRRWLAPVFSKVLGSPTTLARAGQREPGAARRVSPALRKLLRPRGPLARRLLPATERMAGASTMLAAISDGTLSAAPPRDRPGGATLESTTHAPSRRCRSSILLRNARWLAPGAAPPASSCCCSPAFADHRHCRSGRGDRRRWWLHSAATDSASARGRRRRSPARRRAHAGCDRRDAAAARVHLHEPGRSDPAARARRRRSRRCRRRQRRCGRHAAGADRFRSDALSITHRAAAAEARARSRARARQGARPRSSRIGRSPRASRRCCASASSTLRVLRAHALHRSARPRLERDTLREVMNYPDIKDCRCTCRSTSISDEYFVPNLEADPEQHDLADEDQSALHRVVSRRAQSRVRARASVARISDRPAGQLLPPVLGCVELRRSREARCRRRSPKRSRTSRRSTSGLRDFGARLAQPAGRAGGRDRRSCW